MGNKSRNTRQKEAIEAIAKNMEGFFTTEDLFLRVKSKERGIGVATVYRSLKRLGTEGAIHSYSCGRRRIYSTEAGNHCHFICSRCGKTDHFSLKNIDFIKNSVRGKACHFQVDVHGICEKCMRAEASPS